MEIRNKEYKLKYTLRALFIFEQITGKVFKLETLTDEYIFFYSMLLANNPNMELSFDSLIDAIDEDINIMLQFQNYMKSEMEKQNYFITNNTDDKKKS